MALSDMERVWFVVHPSSWLLSRMKTFAPSPPVGSSRCTSTVSCCSFCLPRILTQGLENGQVYQSGKLFDGWASAALAPEKPIFEKGTRVIKNVAAGLQAAYAVDGMDNVASGQMSNLTTNRAWGCLLLGHGKERTIGPWERGRTGEPPTDRGVGK